MRRAQIDQAVLWALCFASGAGAVWTWVWAATRSWPTGQGTGASLMFLGFVGMAVLLGTAAYALRFVLRCPVCETPLYTWADFWWQLWCCPACATTRYAKPRWVLVPAY